MIDIHCHILPGIDDGPETMEESLGMAEAAIADGITHVAATPHSSDEYSFDFARVRALCKDLQERIGSRLELATGCDFHVNAENLAALKQDAARFTINQKNHLLVEFDEFAILPAMDQMLHELQLAGLQPIVTHPERNGLLRRQPERLARWVRLGCAAQVTGGSLTGVFGTSAQRDAMRWIEQGLIHFVASDAHNLRRRPLTLRPAFEAARKRFGEEIARALFVENPRAAWEGRPLPYVPEVADESTQPRRKRFFFF
jgi:protein-tyrosine phosphatase